MPCFLKLKIGRHSIPMDPNRGVSLGDAVTPGSADIQKQRLSGRSNNAEHEGHEQMSVNICSDVADKD